jgi:long-chain-fatty-acid--CoA ligase ACSBG
VLSWRQLMAVGEGVEGSQELDQRLANMAPNLCCHLVYTSGTTGPPKGVMMSHDNLTFTAQ